MSYVAEPYAQFVDDLLLGLTGGSARQRFEFRIADNPFRLDARGPVLPGTVRVFGQRQLAFTRFEVGRDFLLAEGHSVHWLADAEGQPAGDARWPDEGTPFFVSFETRVPAGATLPLTDRNPGSVTRLLAETFGREYAVLSGQLDKVYQAGFLETATGRDLDSLARLVGLRRRGGARGAGSVIFSRRAPAAADIFVRAGTRVSTAEPPPIVFETTAEGILRRGTLSVEVPIEALESGLAGVAAAGAVTSIHRPILGVEAVTNAVPISISSGLETDEALRARVTRALEGGGKATNGALISALTGLPGLGEKDLRLAEDHLLHPGLVKLTVVFPEGEASSQEQDRRVAQAVRAIEDVRPVGVRIEPNFHHAQPVAVSALPVPGELRDSDSQGVPAPVAALGNGAGPFLPVGVRAVIVPVSAALTPEERLALANGARDLLAELFAGFGIGDFVVYNRLVSELMALPGVLDVDLQLSVEGEDEEENPQARPLARANVIPRNPDLRPALAALDVEVGAQLVMLDVGVALRLTGAGTVGDGEVNQQAAVHEIEGRLRQSLGNADDSELSPGVLRRLIGSSESFEVTEAHYVAHYLEAGVRVRLQDPVLPLTGLERLWVSSVRLLQDGEAG